MKIALVRHFQVKRGFPEKMFITPNELNKWLDEYEASDIKAMEVNLESTEWEICFSSDLSRAVKTAEMIFDGEIIKMDKLREVRPALPFKKDIKLPFLLYPLLLKAAWLINHNTQPESKIDVKNRAKAVLDKILSTGREDILVVSHAGLMMFMRKELLKRGFKGPKFNTPDNGKVYIYER